MAYLYNSNADIFGDPQKYNNIEIYPLKLKEYNQYYYYLNVLSFNHKKFNDIKIIRMSFIQFLVILLVENELFNMKSKSEIEEKDLVQKSECLGYLHALFDKTKDNKILKPFTDNFVRIIESCETFQLFVDFLSLITHVPNTDIHLDMKISKMGITNVLIKIGDAILSENGFEELREIILTQNGIDFDYVKAYDPELEAKMQVLKKTRDVEYANFKEQVWTFCIILGKHPNDIQDYTLCQFNQMLERHALLLDYTVYKPLESAGLIKLENGTISHYLTHVKKKGRYDDLYVDKESFTKTTLAGLSQKG